MTQVTITKTYNVKNKQTQYTATCVTPVDPETVPTSCRLSSRICFNEKDAIDDLKKVYHEYMSSDKDRIVKTYKEINFDE